MNWSVIVKLSLISVCSTLVFACNTEAEKTSGSKAQDVSKLESAMTELQNKYDELRQSKPTAALDWASDDLKNIGDWEYKIINLSGKDSTKLENELNLLGKERWQVFWVKEGSQNNIQIMLKRPTVSYLSKLPLSSLGKIMLDGNQ